MKTVADYIAKLVRLVFDLADLADAVHWLVERIGSLLHSDLAQRLIRLFDQWIS